ncbi:transmembrane amino acid transporter protein-domain-containing protein, partial [Phlyctochytrium arcticum]
LSSCINISNTILGSGMLAMPAALAAVGLAPGIFFILFSACASSFGLILLAKTAAHVGRTSSFNSCSKITYPDAAVWFDAAIAIKCFGVSISYLLICGELFPKVIHGFYPNLSPDSVLSTKFFWVTLSMFVVGPFCFLPRLDSLRYTSAFALLAVVYLIFIVVSYFADPLAPGMPARPGAGDIRWWNLNSQVFSQLPIFVFAFTCHQNIFAVYNELDDNAYPRVRGVITTSIGGAFSIYELVGILGYLTFGNGISSNIITEYPPTPFIMGGQLAYTILVLLSYPLQCHPCRASLDKVLGHISDRITPPDELTRARRRAHEISWPKWLGMTLGIMAGSYVVAIFVDDLGKVLAYVGATGSTTICYILPGLFYTKL